MDINYNPVSLDGKTVLVTGASSGIGRATAIECAKLGAKVIVTARNKARLEETIKELQGEGHVFIITDLSNPDEVDQMVASLPALDCVVNNAGMNKILPIQFVTSTELMTTMQVNAISPIMLTQGLLKKKKLGKGSSIVFTSSISSYMTAAGLSIYASSKAAVCGYMRTCAIELGVKGIRSNAVLPGMVETKLINSGTYTDEDKQKDLNLYPLGRYGRPTDIAHGIIYLLSDASEWVTGLELVIDGGRMLK